MVIENEMMANYPLKLCIFDKKRAVLLWINTYRGEKAHPFP